MNVTASGDVVSRLSGQQHRAQGVDARAELGGLEAGAAVLRALGRSPRRASGWWRGQAAAKASGGGDKALSFLEALPKSHARDTTGSPKSCTSGLLSTQHGTVRGSLKIQVCLHSGSLVEQQASYHFYLTFLFFHIYSVVRVCDKRNSIPWCTEEV